MAMMDAGTPARLVLRAVGDVHDVAPTAASEEAATTHAAVLGVATAPDDAPDHEPARKRPDPIDELLQRDHPFG